MYTLETALVRYWSRKTISEQDLMEPAGLGKVVVRTGIAFTAFAVLIIALSWASDERLDRPQLLAADHMRQMPEGK